MKDFVRFSPLKLLEKSSRKGLGAGNLGVLIARAVLILLLTGFFVRENLFIFLLKKGLKRLHLIITSCIMIL